MAVEIPPFLKPFLAGIGAAVGIGIFHYYYFWKLKSDGRRDGDDEESETLDGHLGLQGTRSNRVVSLLSRQTSSNSSSAHLLSRTGSSAIGASNRARPPLPSVPVHQWQRTLSHALQHGSGILANAVNSNAVISTTNRPPLALASGLQQRSSSSGSTTSSSSTGSQNSRHQERHQIKLANVCRLFLGSYQITPSTEIMDHCMAALLSECGSPIGSESMDQPLPTTSSSDNQSHVLLKEIESLVSESCLESFSPLSADLHLERMLSWLSSHEVSLSRMQLAVIKHAVGNLYARKGDWANGVQCISESALLLQGTKGVEGAFVLATIDEAVCSSQALQVGFPSRQRKVWKDARSKCISVCSAVREDPIKWCFAYVCWLHASVGLMRTGDAQFRIDVLDGVLDSLEQVIVGSSKGKGQYVDMKGNPLLPSLNAFRDWLFADLYWILYDTYYEEDEHLHTSQGPDGQHSASAVPSGLVEEELDQDRSMLDWLQRATGDTSMTLKLLHTLLWQLQHGDSGSGSHMWQHRHIASLCKLAYHLHPVDIEISSSHPLPAPHDTHLVAMQCRISLLWGCSLEQLGRYDDAEKVIGVAEFLSSHLDTEMKVQCQVSLGQFLSRLPDPQHISEADEHFERALSIAQKSSTPGGKLVWLPAAQAYLQHCQQHHRQDTAVRLHAAIQGLQSQLVVSVKVHGVSR